MRYPVLWSFLALAVMLSPAAAAPNAAPNAVTTVFTPALCLDAARSAAARHGIPAGMMHAITLVETRRKVGGVSGPWPWTLNINGKGYWHDTRAEALAHAAREIAGGRLSVDLGCFQLNYRWHGENFNALDDMLEPAQAADYAARFLGRLFAETGDWMRAAGLYHSRTPVHSRRYRNLVGQALASLGNAFGGGAGGPGASGAPDPVPRVAGPIQAGSGQAKPAHAIVLATARIASNPGLAAAPGAVMLRMFASPARPLLASPAMKPGMNPGVKPGMKP